MNEQTVKKLFEVIDATAHYKALLMIESYIRDDAMYTEGREIPEQRQEVYKEMLRASHELRQLLTGSVPA